MLCWPFPSGYFLSEVLLWGSNVFGGPGKRMGVKYLLWEVFMCCLHIICQVIVLPALTAGFSAGGNIASSSKREEQQ